MSEILIENLMHQPLVDANEMQIQQLLLVNEHTRRHRDVIGLKQRMYVSP